MRRSPSAILAVAALATACSGGGAESSTSTVVEPATTVGSEAAGAAPNDAASAAEAAADGDAAGDAAAKVGASAGGSVTMTVAASGFEGGDVAIDAQVSAAGEAGPFDEFGSCSGLRDHVGAYSVFVSGPTGAVSVWTADRVTSAGIYDAEVRVEPVAGAPLIASGTLTVLDGLQSGEFLAFGADGGRVEGTFGCTGAPSPTPLVVGNSMDGVLESVEVFALVRDGDAERVVGLAIDGAGPAECPAAVGGDPSPLVVRADGDARLGAITTFELSAEPTTARLRVGAASYEFTDVTLTLEPDGTAGFFAATSPDGTSVDGAFRCT